MKGKACHEQKSRCTKRYEPQGMLVEGLALLEILLHQRVAALDVEAVLQKSMIAPPNKGSSFRKIRQKSHSTSKIKDNHALDVRRLGSQSVQVAAADSGASGQRSKQWVDLMWCHT